QCRLTIFTKEHWALNLVRLDFARFNLKPERDQIIPNRGQHFIAGEAFLQTQCAHPRFVALKDRSNVGRERWRWFCSWERCESNCRSSHYFLAASNKNSILPVAASRFSDRAFEFFNRGEKNRSSAFHRTQIDFTIELDL